MTGKTTRRSSSRKTAAAEAPVDVLHPRLRQNLIGHEAALDEFGATLTTGRLPHAWLLAGPSGIGKATLAWRLASCLLTNPNSAVASISATIDTGPNLFGEALPSPSPSSSAAALSPDCNHPGAKLILTGAHPDLLAIEAPWDDKKQTYKSEIPVELIRKIPAFLSLTPGMGGWRVVLIDGAERMNRASANALLKSLEEPPDHAIILLTTSRADALLPTLRSRCRRLNLTALQDDQIETILTDLSGGGTFTMPTAEDLPALTTLAEGSVGRALDLIRCGGVSLYRDLIDQLTALTDARQTDIVALHRFTEKLGGKGHEAERAYRTSCDLLVWWLDRLCRAAARQSLPATVLPEDSALAAQLSGKLPLDRLLDLWENTSRAIQQTESSRLDRKFSLLGVFLTLQDALR